LTISEGQITPMTQEEFRLLRDVIYQHCGIHTPDSMMFVLERRLKPRLMLLGLTSFRDYYRTIKYGRDSHQELEEIADRVSTNETYFFRGQAQLRAFREEVLPSVLHEHNPGDTIRIWSAGCSSGEEPYTLAILIHEYAESRACRFEITGHDISRKALRTAREAVYRQASFRETPPRTLEQYFHFNGRAYELCKTIKSKVTFGQMNLMDEKAAPTVRDLDIIFCRNVIIYFAPESRRIVLDNLFRRLRPGGYLLLGHSESLINVTTGFQLVPLVNDIVYRRPLSDK
jgi:chemotaxis protein methyltransferase CheR